MTCLLRFIDVRYLRPKREAFDAASYNDVDPAIVDGVGKVGQEDADGGKDAGVEVGVRRIGSPA